MMCPWMPLPSLFSFPRVYGRAMNTQYEESAFSRAAAYAYAAAGDSRRAVPASNGSTVK
jgi:hypothetical protein